MSEVKKLLDGALIEKCSDCRNCNVRSSLNKKAVCYFDNESKQVNPDTIPPSCPLQTVEVLNGKYTDHIRQHGNSNYYNDGTCEQILIVRKGDK